MLLVAEDENLRASLESHTPVGMACVVATSHADALAVLSGERIDGLVVAAPPSGVGFTASLPLLAVHAHRPTLVVTTAPGDAAVVNHAGRYRCRVLSTPFDAEDVLPFYLDVEASRWTLPLELVSPFLAFVTRHDLSDNQAKLLACVARQDRTDRVLGHLAISASTLATRLRQLAEKVGVRNVDAIRPAMLREIEATRGRAG